MKSKDLWVPCFKNDWCPVVPMDNNQEGENDGMLVYTSRKDCLAACRYQEYRYDARGLVPMRLDTLKKKWLIQRLASRDAFRRRGVHE